MFRRLVWIDGKRFRSFPNGKGGIMDSDLSQLEHISAGYTIVANLLIHLIEEGAAC
jgi:hypothetical protein